MSDEPDLIEGTYQIRSVIARGNKTQVCEVLEKGTGRHLAMKLVIEGKPEETRAAKAELKAEAAIAKTLFHPNIIRFESFSTSRDATYLLMEFFRAANVKAQIKSELSSLHSRARPLMEGVCQALGYLHEQGWIHRDLKPENILLNRSGEPKLVDFSLASRYAQGIGKLLSMAGRKTIQGTRTYIAPETILRHSPTPQTDIYSLGVTFFEILTGKTPFQGFTPQDLLNKHLRLPPPLATSINPNLTPEVDQLLLKMLAKKPKDRYANVQEVLAEIRRIKLFLKDAMEIEAERQEQAHAEKMSLTAVIDSRTDADRSQLLKNDPSLAQQFDDERKARQARRKSKPQIPPKGVDKAAPAATSNPQQPAMMPGPMMTPMGMMMPGPMMMPQPMMPPMMMPQPGYPQYPGMPPYMPQPGYPQYPGMPPEGMPAMPAPASPLPQQAYAPPAVVPQPPAAPPPVAPPIPAPPAVTEPDDLEYMTELPDVL